MGSESQHDKIDELASTIDDMKTTVDELSAEDPLPDADVTNLNVDIVYIGLLVMDMAHSIKVAQVIDQQR